MKKILGLSTLLACGLFLSTHPAHAKENLTKLELIILEAPGPVGCHQSHRPQRLLDCEDRQAAIGAFRKLWKADKRRARAVVNKRFSEIPSEKGGYLPMILAVISKDSSFLKPLVRVIKKQPKSELAALARQAIQIIKTGQCEKPQDPRFRELCSLS